MPDPNFFLDPRWPCVADMLPAIQHPKSTRGIIYLPNFCPSGRPTQHIPPLSTADHVPEISTRLLAILATLAMLSAPRLGTSHFGPLSGAAIRRTPKEVNCPVGHGIMEGD